VSAPYGITVGQLKALLGSMPEEFDDRIVVLAKDPEGNGFRTLDEVAVGWYRNADEDNFRGLPPSEYDNDMWKEVEAQVTLDYITDEDTEEHLPLDEHDHPAICLWP
jgi:hypothetical protein